MKKYIMVLLVLTQLVGLVACTDKKQMSEAHTTYGVYDLNVEITGAQDIYVFDDERHLV